MGQVTKLHGGQSLGQRALKGRGGLGPLWPGFSYCYQMWGEIVQRYAKQAGAKWLKKICLFGLFKNKWVCKNLIFFPWLIFGSQPPMKK